MNKLLLLLRFLDNEALYSNGPRHNIIPGDLVEFVLYIERLKATNLYITNPIFNAYVQQIENIVVER